MQATKSKDDENMVITLISHIKWEAKSKKPFLKNWKNILLIRDEGSIYLFILHLSV